MRRSRTALAAVPFAALIAALALLLGAATAPAADAASSCRGAGSLPSSAGGSQTRTAILCLVNRERARHGLKKLRSNRRLRVAAARHSVNMARAKFFSHTSPAGSTMTARIKRAGYTRSARSWAVGENIAWGAGGAATPQQIVAAWMRSSGHRANILNGRYREIGVGVALGAPVRVSAAGSGATYTTDFGVRG